MVFTFCPIVTLQRLLQDLNVPLSIISTEFPIITSDRLSQLRKALLPSVLTLFGMVSVTILLELNASLPIVSKDSGRDKAEILQ